MSSLLVLPTPLPSSAISLGQLITDPLSNASASLKPSRAPPSKQTAIQSKYEKVITHDEHGRFITNLNSQAPETSNHITIKAEQMIHTTIDRPTTIFNQLRRDTTTRAFLRKMAQDGTPVYFVTGLQTLRKPTFKRAVVKNDVSQGSNTTAPAEATPDSPHLHLPVRRVDSASNMVSAQDSQQQDECVLAVELFKLKCRVGAINEPHTISDIDYSWSYHGLDGEDEDEEQLSIGLGKPLEASELRALAGMMMNGDAADEQWDASGDESDDGGIGGF